MGNSIPTHSAPSISLDVIVEWLLHRGSRLYGGEAVTQLEHAMQCAALARAAGAPPTLVAAALLHDIGHLADSNDDRQHPHGPLGAQLLSALFGPAVTEPIRMHADAKRYLCAREPAYWSGLSQASKCSLEWQGGPFTQPEALSFIVQPYANDAVRLRLWDDAAKVPGMATPPIEAFIAAMAEAALPSSRLA